MDFKKGNWKFGDALDINNESDLLNGIDDKMSKNIMQDLRK
jgi:hypothetical protein